MSPALPNSMGLGLMKKLPNEIVYFQASCLSNGNVEDNVCHDFNKLNFMIEKGENNILCF